MVKGSFRQEGKVKVRGINSLKNKKGEGRKTKINAREEQEAGSTREETLRRREPIKEVSAKIGN